VLGTIRASKLALVPEVTESTARTLLVGVRPRYTPIATALVALPTLRAAPKLWTFPSDETSQ
jgi:hypothetical protein